MSEQIKVELLEYMGSDRSIAESAWTSSLSLQAKEKRSQEDVERVVKMLIKEKHATPIESVVFKFWIKMPIAIDRQHMTHRIACLSGDTKLWFDLPSGQKDSKYRRYYKSVEDLYEKWNYGVKSATKWNTTCRKNHKNRIKKMKLRNVDETTGIIQHTTIKNIWSTGIQPVYEFSFSGGQKLKMTLNHRIFTSKGWNTMGNILSIKNEELPSIIPQDVEFHANGQYAYKDLNIMTQLRTQGLSVQQMADELGISYHTVRKWLKVHNLSFSKEETCFKVGQVPWNKNLKYKQTKPYVITEKRKAFNKRISGENSNFWRGGISKETVKIRAECTLGLRKQALFRDQYTCQLCASKQKLEVHHIIPIWKNKTKVAELDNLQTLCSSCHKKQHGFMPKEIISKRKTTKLVSTHLVKLESVKYLGELPTYDLEVEGPYHNFIAEGICVHNSHNGASGRYRTMPTEYYNIPEDVVDIFSKIKFKNTIDIMDKLGNNKGTSYCSEFDTIDSAYNTICETANHTYSHCIELGKEAERNNIITNKEYKRFREFIRGMLPLANMTERVTIMNLRSFANYQKLRNSEHAQPEIKRVAELMLQAVEQANICPIALQALKDNKWEI